MGDHDWSESPHGHLLKSTENKNLLLSNNLKMLLCLLFCIFLKIFVSNATSLDVHAYLALHPEETVQDYAKYVMSLFEACEAKKPGDLAHLEAYLQENHFPKCYIGRLYPYKMWECAKCFREKGQFFVPSTHLIDNILTAGPVGTYGVVLGQTKFEDPYKTRQVDLLNLPPVSFTGNRFEQLTKADSQWNLYIGTDKNEKQPVIMSKKKDLTEDYLKKILLTSDTNGTEKDQKLKASLIKRLLELSSLLADKDAREYKSPAAFLGHLFPKASLRYVRLLRRFCITGMPEKRPNGIVLRKDETILEVESYNLYEESEKQRIQARCDGLLLFTYVAPDYIVTENEFLARILYFDDPEGGKDLQHEVVNHIFTRSILSQEPLECKKAVRVNEVEDDLDAILASFDEEPQKTKHAITKKAAKKAKKKLPEKERNKKKTGPTKTAFIKHGPVAAMLSGTIRPESFKPVQGKKPNASRKAVPIPTQKSKKTCQQLPNLTEKIKTGEKSQADSELKQEPIRHAIIEKPDSTLPPLIKPSISVVSSENTTAPNTQKVEVEEPNVLTAKNSEKLDPKIESPPLVKPMISPVSPEITHTYQDPTHPELPSLIEPSISTVSTEIKVALESPYLENEVYDAFVEGTPDFETDNETKRLVRSGSPIDEARRVYDQQPTPTLIDRKESPEEAYEEHEEFPTIVDSVLDHLIEDEEVEESAELDKLLAQRLNYPVRVALENALRDGLCYESIRKYVSYILLQNGAKGATFTHISKTQVDQAISKGLTVIQFPNGNLALLTLDANECGNNFPYVIVDPALL